MRIIKRTFDEEVENELVTLRSINHENIVKYYEHFDGEIDDLYHTCIILEYCEVCLFYKNK